MDFLRIEAPLTSQSPSKVVSLLCHVPCNVSACSVSLCLTVLLRWVNAEGIWGGRQLRGPRGALELVSACADFSRRCPRGAGRWADETSSPRSLCYHPSEQNPVKNWRRLRSEAPAGAACWRCPSAARLSLRSLGCFLGTAAAGLVLSSWLRAPSLETPSVSAADSRGSNSF